MGITVSIVSAVLKSVVGDRFGSGLAKELIGISIDGISQKGINEIINFINDGKAKINKIFSRENMKSMGISKDETGYVVAEIKDLFAKINITDEVLRECKYDSMDLCAFLWNTYRESKKGYIENENAIKRCLFAVAGALIELVCESETFEDDILIQISNSANDVTMGLQNISDYMEDNFNKLDDNNRIILEILRIILEQNQEKDAENKYKKQKVKSRTEEYVAKWNENMFLNNFDKRDKNAGINVELGEVYLDEYLPHYIWENDNGEEPLTDLKELLLEYIIEKKDSKMLVILGQPGIGKSTLITWLTANFIEQINDIFVYKFASDFENMDWENEKVSNKVLEELGLNYSDLNGKILIIDGFDEVNIESSVPSALYIAKLFFHKIPYRAILKRNGGGNYGKTKNLYYQAQQ